MKDWFQMKMHSLKKQNHCVYTPCLIYKSEWYVQQAYSGFFFSFMKDLLKFSSHKVRTKHYVQSWQISQSQCRISWWLCWHLSKIQIRISASCFTIHLHPSFCIHALLHLIHICCSWYILCSVPADVLSAPLGSHVCMWKLKKVP